MCELTLRRAMNSSPRLSEMGVVAHADDHLPQPARSDIVYPVVSNDLFLPANQ